MVRVVVASFALLAALIGISSHADSPPVPQTAHKYKLSGPFTQGNLTLFMVHGPDAVANKKIITLKDALEKKIVTVNETSNVNMLSAENTSADVEVFLMAGDVVKGGKQDRAIAFDIILPSKSGVIPVPAFCVEHNRWTKRGGEAVANFAGSEQQVCTKDLKTAINGSRSQGEVWKEVAVAQKKISDNIGRNVQNAASPSSLQLAMEDKEVQAKVAEYEKALTNAAGDKKDVIGMVVVVNGAISTADVFGSAELFRMLYPKLLKSAAIEAFSEFKADAKFEGCKAETVEAFFAESSKAPMTEVAMETNTDRGGRANNIRTQQSAAARVQEPETAAGTAEKAKPVESRVRVLEYKSPKTLLIEYQDKLMNNVSLHRCYIAKDEPKPAPAAPAQPTQQRGAEKTQQKDG